MRRPSNTRTLLAGTGVVALAAGTWVVLGLTERAERREVEERTLEPLVLPRKPLASSVPRARAEPVPDAARGGVDPWVAENNRATLLLGDGELERAVELFERCHEARPEDDIFRGNLAEALVRLSRSRYEAHRIPEALAALTRALELAPERDDATALARLHERWSSEALIEQNQWTERSDLFELSYDTSRLDILENSQVVLDHLERCYERLHEWFGRDPVREHASPKIRVVLYSPAEFDRLTGIGDWAGGVFDGVVRVSLQELALEDPRWKDVLAHELVHAFIHALAGDAVPGWLNEGLAQFLEDGRPKIEEARERFGEGPLFPLERLEGSLAGWEDPLEISRAYAQSLLIVERVARDWGDEALRRMVLSCGDGILPERSFEAWASVPFALVLESL